MPSRWTACTRKTFCRGRHRQRLWRRWSLVPPRRWRRRVQCVRRAIMSNARWTRSWSGREVSVVAWLRTIPRCTTRRSRSDSAPTGRDSTRRKSDRSSTKPNGCARCTWPSIPTTNTDRDDDRSRSRQRPWDHQRRRPESRRRRSTTVTSLPFRLDILQACTHPRRCRLAYNSLVCIQKRT